MSATATYVLEIDWNNDGDFGDANENVTSDVYSVETIRGRDYASQLTGRAMPGQLVAGLKNLDGTYSSFNASSPIYGNIVPGRKIRLRTTSPSAATLWTGYLQNILPAGSLHGAPYVTLKAVGAIGKMSQKNVSPAKKDNQATGSIIGTILDSAGWGSERSIDAGQTTVGKWFVNRLKAINAVRDIENTELGFFYESAAGDLVFEDRHHRLKEPHLTSQQTYSDVSGMGYATLEQNDPLREIYNEAIAMVKAYETAGASEVLWTLQETPTVSPGATVIYWAEYPNVEKDVDTGAFVDSWDTPVVGTDITQTGVDNGDIGLSVSKFANSMKIQITNNNVLATATLTLVRAKGTKVTKKYPARIAQEDSASQTAYGKRTFRLPSKWLQSTIVAQDYVNYLIGRYKNPVPLLTMSFVANRDSTAMTEALTRDISDRITVVATGSKTKLGINTDFFIETIQHRIREGGKLHEVVFNLSESAGDSGWWVLGISKLGTETKLAY